MHKNPEVIFDRGLNIQIVSFIKQLNDKEKNVYPYCDKIKLRSQKEDSKCLVGQTLIPAV